MPDRENVIRHFQDAISASGDGNHWRFVRADIIEDAIALLRKQEPVKPKVLVGTYVCGNCRTRLEQQCLIGTDVLINENFNYCPTCGRKVLWDG